jgi:Lrp/AsnC family transcriptional regulator, regulator for asnA, asnC and gidA
MLDNIDKELITQVQSSGRLSYVELAQTVKVSERTVRNRMKRLLDSGIIKIRAIPDLNILGYTFTAIVGIQVQLGRLKDIARELAKHPNICFIVNVTGQYDMIAIIVARSSGEFAVIMEDFVSPIPGVLKTETFVGLNTYKGEHGNLETGQLIENLNIRP